MGKSPKQEIEITDYRMSMHYGICEQADELNAIYVGEKEAWTGSVTTEQDIQINRPDLFGGPKKEGGVVGVARWMPGGPDQVTPEHLARKLGLTSATAPGYRGFSSIWFTGGQTTVNYDLPGFGSYPVAANPDGFLWGTNNPYLRSIWMKIKRSPKVLDPSLRMVRSGSPLSISTNGDTVTVNGVSATVQQGVPTMINGARVLLDRETLIVNETQITVSAVATPYTATVSGVGGTFDGNSATINGTTIEVTGTGVVVIGGDYGGYGGVAITANYNATVPGTEDANPAAIVYECLVNRTWGAGMSPSLIDTDSFTAAATQLKSEGFGLSLQWTRQSEIEDFVNEILDHIQATLFVNPRNGLMTIKLFRADYDPDTLPLLTPDNCTITNFARKAWGETVNEIVVTWTNPENEQEETVTAQNLANIVIQGGVVSDSRNYYGVRNKDLALRLAFRELALSSSPIASFEIEVDRTAWKFVPGGCVKLDDPEEGIDGLILRIVNIDYGKPGDPTIKITGMEDLFSLPASHFDDPDSSTWLNRAKPPTPLDFVRLITAPGYFTSSALLTVEASALQYPEVFAAVLASSSISDTHSYQLYGIETLPNGDVVSNLVGVKPLLGFAQLPLPLDAEAQSLLQTFGTIYGGIGPRTAGFVFIGHNPEAGQEIALIQSFDENGYVLKRGVLDTVPRDWPVGTPCWFVQANTPFLDVNNIHSADETVVYKALPTTSKGTLSIDEAPVAGAILSGRPYLPNRPANVIVAGTSFGTIDLSASPPATVHVSWANRNRTMEDSQVLSWTDASMTPEDGQTTTIYVMRIDGTVITTHDGLTGTSFDVPIASFGDAAVADVRVTAKRDGLESLQGHTVRAKVRVNGWGDNWGDNWGGNPLDAPPPGDPAPVPPGPEYTPPPDYTFPPDFDWDFFKGGAVFP